MEKIDVIIEFDSNKFIAYLLPKDKYLGFYGEGYTTDEAEDNFMLSYEEYKTEEISEGKNPKEYNFNFIIADNYE